MCSGEGGGERVTGLQWGGEGGGREGHGGGVGMGGGRVMGGVGREFGGG